MEEKIDGLSKKIEGLSKVIEILAKSVTKVSQTQIKILLKVTDIESKLNASLKSGKNNLKNGEEVLIDLVEDTEPNPDTGTRSSKRKRVDFAITFYCDGSVSGHTKGNTTTCKTGWAFKILFPLLTEDGDVKYYDCGYKTGKVVTDKSSLYYVGASRTTSNTAELTAVIEVLRFITSLSQGTSLVTKLFSSQVCPKIKIYTDSRYTIEVLTTEKSSPKNSVLLETGRRFLKNVKNLGFEIDFMWIKSHTGYVHHDEVDKLASDVQFEHSPFSERTTALRFLLSKYQLSQETSEPENGVR